LASFRFVAVGLALSVGLGAGELLAAPTPADRALATELFNQGRAELERGQVASACAKLEESQRLDPGGGTLLNVAKCHEQQGRTATAWTEFTEALAIAEREGRNERIAFATERIAVLQAKLSRVVVRVPPGSDKPELVILRDGTPVARAAWGTAMPMDPGRHLLSVGAEGHQPWQVEIEVGPDADRDEVIVPALEALPLPPVIEPPQAPIEPAPKPPVLLRPGPPAPVVAPEVPASIPPGKIAGWTVASVGFTALGAATVSGIVTFVKDAASDSLCEPTCDQEGYALNQEAKLAADVSTALFIVGAVAAGVGVTFVLLSPEAGAPTVSLSPGVGGGTLRVAF
jgi:hypothetical protein